MHSTTKKIINIGFIFKLEHSIHLLEDFSRLGMRAL